VVVVVVVQGLVVAVGLWWSSFWWDRTMYKHGQTLQVEVTVTERDRRHAVTHSVSRQSRG
jgi:hypothetical protein